MPVSQLIGSGTWEIYRGNGSTGEKLAIIKKPHGLGKLVSGHQHQGPVVGVHFASHAVAGGSINPDMTVVGDVMGKGYSILQGSSMVAEVGSWACCIRPASSLLCVMHPQISSRLRHGKWLKQQVMAGSHEVQMQAFLHHLSDASAKNSGLVLSVAECACPGCFARFGWMTWRAGRTDYVTLAW